MLILVGALVILTVATADVPLPRSRPSIPDAPGTISVETPHGPPTECDERLVGLAMFEPKPTLTGPGECGGDDLVSLSAVLLPNGRRAAVKPAATLRCEMAEALAGWVRDDVAPRIADHGGELAVIQQDDSYECRNRNRGERGKVSEHAHGRAIDLRGFVLADKSVIALTDIYASKGLRTMFHDSACRRFSTVLGPGEPYHEEHVHLDVIARRGDHRICAWAVREPPSSIAKATPGKGPEPASDGNEAPGQLSNPKPPSD